MNRPHHPITGLLSRRALLTLGAAISFCLLLGWLAYRTFSGIYLDSERQLASQRLDALALSLEATLSRNESLPGLLALDPSLLALLRQPDSPERAASANAYLEAAQQGVGVSVAFLIDAQGKTLAASNWRQARSFVGHNYAFRPYFIEAISNGLGRFYGVGVTTGEPGYFLAAPVRDGERPLGVIVLKVGLEAIEQALAGAGETLFLADADGVIFLSPERRLRYRTLAPLSETVAARLGDTRQYGSQAITTVSETPVRTDQAHPVRLTLPGDVPRDFLITSRPVGSLGWQLVQLGDPGEAHSIALGGALAVSFAGAFLIGLAAHLRHRQRRREELRRVYAELEQRIAERTLDLTDKIAALEQTEAILRETRNSAVQAGKLTVLGQMSAGITHELNQPLAALQTFADNAQALLERGRHAEVAENLAMISDLIERTGRIVRQLKTFSRKESAVPQAVTVRSAVEHALMIIEPRRRELIARIVVNALPDDLQVMAEAGRLEQILVNLMRNGLDAMAGQAEPSLEISTQATDRHVSLSVRDHGPGISDEVLARLFEPFYTTKTASDGLGLGLAISLTIAESYGGTLRAHNAPDGGAIFVLTLDAPLIPKDQHAPSDA